jgi:hypothetical protein
MTRDRNGRYDVCNFRSETLDTDAFDLICAGNWSSNIRPPDERAALL